MEIRRRRKKMKKLACLTIVLLFSLSAANADEPIRYTNDSFARLSYINGNVYIQRAIEVDYEEAFVNMPVEEGDRMGTTEGRAEIYMGRGKYLRLDHHTKIDFLNLPNPENDLTRIQIWRGNIFFSILSLKKEKAIEIHTDDASFYVLEAGLYRIDVREEETEIFVFRGLLEAAGETGSVLIREAQRMGAMDGHFLGRPSAFAAVVEDGFDRWSEVRDHEVQKRMARRYMPAELEDFEYELASYGNWIYVFPYGYVWVPGGIAADWRPYWQGRWMWSPVCGWTWLPYEPWGWATVHYGRWHWSVGFGWYWIPTNVWGPGWVQWYSGYDYIGWAPVSFGGRPSIVERSRALTVIHRDQLKARNISKVALSQNSVKNIERLSLTKTQPVVKQASSGQIRLKNLKDNNASIKVTESEALRRVRTQIPEKTRSTEIRNIPKTTTETESKRTRTTLGNITSIKSTTSKSSSSKSSSSKSPTSSKIKPSSISKSSSPSKVNKSSPPKSSSPTRSGSKKVKKKK
jgi:hypothetical protein